MKYIGARHVETSDYENKSLCDQARDFLDVMRKEGYVHGALGPFNVLITKNQKLQFIGFDWSERHDIAKYHLSIFTAKISWPEGVAADKKLLSEHDEILMKKLFKV